MTLRSTKWVALACMTTASITAGPLFGGIGAAAPASAASSGAVGLSINGSAAGFVRSVEGGDNTGVVTTGQRIPYLNTFVEKKLGQPGFSNLKIGLGADSSRPLWLLVKSALDGREQKFDGSFSFLDLGYRATSQKNFKGAVITDLTIPALGGLGPIYFGVTFDEEDVAFTSTFATFSRPIGVSKSFAGNAYTVAIDGIGTLQPKVDAIDVKAKAKSMTVTNLHLTFPANTITSPAFANWAKSGGAKGGRITLLGPDLTEQLLDLDLHGLSMVKFAINEMDAGASHIAMNTVELAVSQITIGGGTALGP